MRRARVLDSDLENIVEADPTLKASQSSMLLSTFRALIAEDMYVSLEGRRTALIVLNSYSTVGTDLLTYYKSHKPMAVGKCDSGRTTILCYANCWIIASKDDDDDLTFEVVIDREDLDDFHRETRILD